MSDEKMRYSFGANWNRYLDDDFDQNRERTAREHLLNFLGRDSLEGRSFLDAGSGSGIHSLAAFNAGARRIVSFDYDPLSVEATRRLHARAGSPDNWIVMQGDALDAEFCAGLGLFDIVYSWGVLHHTGRMWDAFDNVAACMASDGCFYTALYASEMHLDPTPEKWLDIKRRYNNAGSVLRFMMEMKHLWSAVCLRRLSNLIRLPQLAEDYARSRGMAVMADIRDWLGGYPMEFSSMAQVGRHAADHCGLELTNVSFGEWNTEYLFVRTGSSASTIPLEYLELPPLIDNLELLRGKKFYIFGTAAGAELLARRAMSLGLNLAGFIDISRTDEMFGLPIMSVQDFARLNEPDSDVVLSNRWVRENADRLRKIGHRAVWNGHPLVTAMVLGAR